MKKIVSLTAVLLTLGGIFAESPLAATGENLSFVKQVVIDQQGFGYEAYRLLVPQGWRFEGGVWWDFNKFPAEASTGYTLSSPDGELVLCQYPHMNMAWSDDPNLRFSYSQGGTEIAQPAGALEFIQGYFVPRARSACSNVKIANPEALPELAQRTAELTQFQIHIFGQISPYQFPYEIRADAGRATLEYLEGNKKFVEEVTASIGYFIAYTPNLYGGTSSGISWIPIVTSFKAPAERMDEAVRIFRIVMDSRRDNPVWPVNCIRLSAVVTREQLRHNRAIFERMQQMSRDRSDLSDMMMESYQKRSQAYDRMFENYSEAIRGVDSYRDPINDWTVEIPTGYGNAWTDGSNYVFSDDANFNPNVGSTTNWERMSRQP